VFTIEGNELAAVRQGNGRVHGIGAAKSSVGCKSCRALGCRDVERDPLDRRKLVETGRELSRERRVSASAAECACNLDEQQGGDDDPRTG
jgi:hypothetical protein